MQIERDETLRPFQSYTNRFRHSYEASYSTNPLYYSTNIGRKDSLSHLTALEPPFACKVGSFPMLVALVCLIFPRNLTQR